MAHDGELGVSWAAVAARVAEALAVRPGDVVQVRDHAGRAAVLHEFLLALEVRGVTPLPELTPPAYVRRLLRETPPALLAAWDRHRAVWLERDIDCILVLQGGEPGRGAPREARVAWDGARARLVAVDERRRLPIVLVAVPTAARARQAGLTLAALEAAVLPGLLAPPAELAAEVARVRAVLEEAEMLTVATQAGELHLRRGGRPWLSDAGTLPARATPEPGAAHAATRCAGGAPGRMAGSPAEASAAGIQPVNNLPGGALYTTVLEEETTGSLWAPRAVMAREATLQFQRGRLSAISAGSGGAQVLAYLDGHSGEPRRVSHVGLGLNPRLRRPVGWTLVDEHAQGSLLLALGENRYLGGANASSLNVDIALPGATLRADGRTIVVAGRLVV